MHVPWALALLTTGFLVEVQGGVPTIDIKAICKLESAQIQSELSQCVRDEQAARDKLIKTWSTYPATDRASCTTVSTTSGIGSYVELLSCLEDARDAKKKP